MQILDGGTGRQLKRIGAPFRQPEWSALALMESPEHVVRVHTDFIDAGADIITTNSYAVVPFHIGEDRFLKDGGDLLDLAGRLAAHAQKAATRQVRVAAGIPPMFGSYVPENFDPDKADGMLSLFRDKLLPHCDLVLGETLSCIAEVTAFQEVFADCGKPVWISLTLEDDQPQPNAPKLRSGESLDQALEAARRHKFDAILFNCSQPEVMADGVSRARELLGADVSIGVYANAFPPKNTATVQANKEVSEIRQDLTPDRYREFALEWLALGATIIGGCCGVGPEHIRALKEIE
jgi:S-methylmethionine-dependent homocysteine/selenocysteine methylase